MPGPLRKNNDTRNNETTILDPRLSKNPTQFKERVEMVEKAPTLTAKTLDTVKDAAKQRRVYRRRGRRRSRYRRHKVRPRARAISVLLGAFAKLVRERKYLHERTPRSRVRRSASRIDRGEGTDIIFHRQRGSMRSPNSRYLRPRRPALVNRSLLESLHRGRHHALYRESMFEKQHRRPTIQAKFGFANDTARILRNTPVPRVVKKTSRSSQNGDNSHEWRHNEMSSHIF